MPGNCVFLVDTFNTLAGVKNAVLAGQYLQSRGGKLLGVRLDSGDLGYLSIEARKIMDAAGFKDAVIVGSNDLDEMQILNLKAAGAKINVWGVGTKLVTAYDDPALGGVYKLVAIRKDKAADWSYKLKLSEQISKITTPGKQQVRRFTNAGEYVADMIYDELSLPQAEDFTIIDPLDVTRRKKIPKDCQSEDLLVPIFDQGLCVYDRGGLLAARQRSKRDLGLLNESVKRIANPYSFPVGLEQTLSDRKSNMILDLRGF